MERRRPTVHDVAQRAGVSIATVSFAFRRPEQVREETRNTVLRAAREIGYIPNASARGLVRGRTGALGLHAFDLLLERPQGGPTADRALSMLPSPAFDAPQTDIPWDDANDDFLSDPRAFPLYVDEVQRGFELECKSQGRPVLLSSGSDSAMSVAESAGRVDGLAIFPGPSAVTSLEGVSLMMPVVLFSSPIRDPSHHRVLADNTGGMRDLVTHLVMQHGIQSVGFVGALTVADYRERFDALREALTSLGLPAPVDVIDDTVLGEGREFAGMVEHIRNRSLPAALVCASDQLALALLDLLAEYGVSVPGEVAVTGFDGIVAGRLSRPTLTTVRQPMESMGRVAARLLIDGANPPGAPGKVVRLGTKLITRASCGCVDSLARST